MRYFFYIAILCFFSGQLSAQKINPKYTFNVEIGLPVAMGNESFKDIMQGLACANIYGQYSLPFHLNFGAGIRYSLFTINEFSINEENFGEIHTGAAFLKVGWDKFHTDRFATDFGVKFGYSMNFANTDLNKVAGVNPRIINSTIIEPTLGLILAADERNSYRWNIGWCIQGYGFSPNTIGLPTNGLYDPTKFNKLTNFLVVGFGYTHYFKNNTPN